MWEIGVVVNNKTPKALLRYIKTTTKIWYGSKV